MEQWKHYVYNYDVSDEGRVRNRVTGRILKQQVSRSGYLICNISCGNRQDRMSIRVHIAVAQCFIENPNHLPEINHVECRDAVISYSVF